MSRKKQKYHSWLKRGGSKPRSRQGKRRMSKKLSRARHGARWLKTWD